MALIKVILGGVGVKYTDAHGNLRFVLKTSADKPFECDDRLAESYVRKGVAEYVVEPQPAELPSEDPQQDAPADSSSDSPDESGKESGKKTGHLDPAQLETMTNEQLKNLAEDIGIDVSKCKKKADYVAAIAAVEVEVDDEEDPDDMPDLNAADPV